MAIGLLDAADAHHARARETLRDVRHLPLLMAASTYSEILVRPLRTGSADAVELFVDELRVNVVPVDRAIARRAAELRARHRALRLPDAFTLATAELRDARLLTFDDRLRRIAR